MKISCNVKQGTSLVKNSSQTVEIKDKTNEKKPYVEQDISNHKLNLDDSIKIFNNLISKGPIYMYSVCQQTQNNSSASSLLASLLLLDASHKVTGNIIRRQPRRLKFKMKVCIENT